MSANGFFAKITTLDVSELKTTGIYMNVNGTPTYYGLVIVFAYGDYVAQFFLAKDGSSYVRNLDGSSWTSWARFDK